MEKRLLILTQKMDKEDPILGFFHNWVLQLAASLPAITVVCLEQGSHDLPSNVKVLSLGKERGQSRLGYIAKFYGYLWSERKNYDAVFVHMNQEYVLLGGVVWRLLGKRILMWRNHRYGNFLTRLAILLSNRVYATSPNSFTARFKKKTKLMPAGIDTNVFRPVPEVGRLARTVLYAGRISPNKRPDLLLKAADGLWTEGEKFKLSIVGDAAKGSEGYYGDLRKAAALLEMENVAAFYDAVSQEHMPALYSSHEIFANLTETGSFDKTVLEAAACGTLPVVSNIAFRFMFPPEYRELLYFKENDAEDLKGKLQALLALPQSKKESIAKNLRELVVEKHSLGKLVKELISDIDHE